ncbi:hypothetical protein EYC80_001210 [Monilinia laxa]|uniref:Uncharacterized protein n=1 Tax=Monilinia laxa TaxID=61186 RepID=A0A5N6K8G5_MONLA|nr:hypothetical protein EYC80_001210 [Monilinia laxa]
MQPKQPESAATQNYPLTRSERKNPGRKLRRKQTKGLGTMGDRTAKKKKKMQKLRELRRCKREGKELVTGVRDLELEENDELMKEVGEGEAKEGGTKVSAFEGFQERGGMMDDDDNDDDKNEDG